MCTCYRDSKRTYQSTGDSPIDKAIEQFNGQWKNILESYGAKLPSGRHHGPCPVCGGKDRFRFDDKNGRGTWFCSQCEPQSGGGLLLLSRYLGKPTIEVAKELIGDDCFKSVAPKRTHQINDDEIRKANIEQAKKGAAVLMDSSFMADHEYMTNKGLTGKWPTNGEPIFSKGEIICTGELLLVPAYKNGELVNVQKITKDGIKRPLWGGDMAGVQHIIDGKTKSIAVVEGYATGITVNLMTGYKTYVSFNTGNLAAAVKQAKADHPDSRIIIFADHDELDETHNRRPGEYFANEAAAPFGAIVALPPELGDWDDYRQKHGDDNCKSAMRDAIKKDIGIVEKAPALEPVPIKEPAKNTIHVEAPEPAQMPVFGSWLNNPPQQSKQKNKVGLDALPDGISLDDLDVDHPPGLAGDIVKYIETGAHRRLTGGAYSAFAIQCMAMAGAGISGYMGTKLSLVTIVLGVSAAGKERPQKVIKELLASSDIHVYGDIRSDKDVIRAAVYDHGRCFYIMDEAHKLLGKSLGGADKNTANVPAVLMELATASIMPLSKLHQEEFTANIMMRVNRLEKTLAAKEDIRLGYNQDLEQPKIKAIDLDIEKIKANIEEQELLIKVLEGGIKNPSLNLVASSTPQKMAAMIDEDGIESGFLGRAGVFDCGVEREARNWDLWGKKGSDNHEDKVLFEHLKAEIGMIAQMANDVSKKRVEDEFNGIEYKTIATPEADAMMYNIARHYDEHEYRNHNRLGALYARLPERVMSVASSLALYNVVGGNITIETDHVRYALMIAINSIKHLESNLRVNEAVDGQTVEAKLDGIKEAILKRLKVSKGDKEDGWRYKTQLRDYLKRQKYYIAVAEELRKHDQDAFENSIISLMGEGKIISNGKKVKLKQ
jgi:phage/plasmid primase-like uncharacterized protein